MPARSVRLRALLERGCTPIPGCFSALVAIAARDTGFEACYVSGGATSVNAGLPDIGLLSLEHFTNLIREITRSSGLSVLADADTGFGEEEMVRRTVLEYAHAGAAALHIEDQVFPKRCGHLDGKQLIPTEHAVEKIRWASEAARDADELAGVEGLDAAIERARAYVDAGATMIFPEGLRSPDEFARFARAARAMTGPDPRGGPYLLANMTEFGKTPSLTLREFDALGYSCVIYPVSMLRIAIGAVVRALAVLRDQGSLQSLLPEMLTRQQLYDLIAYDPTQPWRSPAG